MHELQSHPGLQFYIIKIDGTLKYSFSWNRKTAKKYEISDIDFEGITGDHIKEEQGAGELLAVGTEASAVGLQILLVKNEGTLNMEFKGKSGGHASWTFEGLQEVKGGSVYANAGIQTNRTPAKETGTQTIPTKQCSVLVQTELTSQEISEGMKKLKKHQDKESLPEAVMTGDKRKLPAVPNVANKRARSFLYKSPWPEAMRISCSPSIPSIAGPIDSHWLVVDVKRRQVWVHMRSGERHCQKAISKQADLRDPGLRARCVRRPGQRAPEEVYKYNLDLFVKTRTGKDKTSSQVHLKDQMHVLSKVDGEYKITSLNIHHLMRAIVYCIGETSGRQAVHDPGTDLKLICDRIDLSDENGESPDYGERLRELSKEELNRKERKDTYMDIKVRW